MKLFELLHSQPQLIMYDLDGTLVDSLPDLAIATDNMLADMNLPEAGQDKIKPWIGNGIPTLIKRALTDDFMVNQPGIVDEDVFKKAHERFKYHYDRELGRHSTLYPGTLEFLMAAQAAGIKQAIVTNKSEQFTDKLLKLLDIDGFFDLFLGGDSLKEKKPDPLPLQHAMNYFSTNAHNSLMVGDSSNDIKAAKAADVKVIGLTYGYNHGQPIEHSNPDLVVSDLSALI